MSMNSATLETTLTHAAGSEMRSGPVLVGAGGHGVAATVRAGALIAKRLGRGMTLLSVIEPVPGDVWDADGAFGGTFFEERAASARNHLARVIDPHGSEADWPVEVLAGEVPELLSRVAHEREVPLLVMGIGRRRPLARLLRAETVLRAVRHADCPVLAVADSLTIAPTTAAVGVDFSPSSAYAAQTVVSLLGAGGTLHLVHVWQPSRADDESAARDNDVFRRHLPDRFRRFIASLALPSSISVKTELREGRAAERLVDFAEAHRVDIIAIGRNGRRVVQRLLVGGVAERVLRSAVCSVLIAPDLPLADARLAFIPHGASAQILERTEWETTLETLSRRNAGRVVSLDVYDPSHGIESHERGYILFGLTYSSRERLLTIILGETNGRRQHRTRQVFEPRDIAVVRDAAGEVLELRIQSVDGETLVLLHSVIGH